MSFTKPNSLGPYLMTVTSIRLHYPINVCPCLRLLQHLPTASVGHRKFHSCQTAYYSFQISRVVGLIKVSSQTPILLGTNSRLASDSALRLTMCALQMLLLYCIVVYCIHKTAVNDMETQLLKSVNYTMDQTTSEICQKNIKLQREATFFHSQTELGMSAK